MKFKIKRSNPKVSGISVTMTVKEAELLVKFIGPTRISHVRDILPDESEVVQYGVNDALFGLFNVLGDSLLEITSP